MSVATTTMPRGQIFWNALPDRAKVERKSLKIALTIGSLALGLSAMAAGIIPWIGAIPSGAMLAAGHMFDRLRNGVTATDELTFRAQMYTKEIRTTLDRMGIKRGNGKFATVDELKEAAKYNNALQKLHAAPLHEKTKENNSSAMMNTGIWAAGALIPGASAVAGVGGVANHIGEAAKIAKEGGALVRIATGAKKALPAAKVIARDMAGGLAGGAIASALSAEKLDPQTLAEAITAAVQDAQTQGVPVSEVLSPKLLFTLRVAQDASLAKHIEVTSGKSFHTLDERAQLEVMARNDALMKSAEMDVVQISGIQDPVQLVDAVRGLGATEADLDPTRQYQVGTPAVSWVDKETARRAAATARRAAANDPQFNAPTNVRSIGGHTARLNAQRAAATIATGRKA